MAIPRTGEGSMTSGDVPLQGVPRRAWYRTIAGKLVTAFTLIAVLTVIASVVALVQFRRIDEVITGLTGSSLPAVKYSLAVETSAKAIAAGGAQIAAATSETQRFFKMSESSEQIGNLWSALNALRAAGGASAPIGRLQTLIASIDSRLGELDRVVQEKIVQVAMRERAARRIFPESERLARAIAAAASAGGSPAAPALSEMQADAGLAGSLLHQVSLADRKDAIEGLQRQFDEVSAKLAASVETLKAAPGFDVRQGGEIETALQAFAALGAGRSGLFQIRSEEIARQQAADAVQVELQNVAVEMEAQVVALVSSAEAEAARAATRSINALTNSRFWLIAISLFSLGAAILIVWLFVIRYIVVRLRQLTRGMMAVASGQLDTAIPAPAADELGDMSRALEVFRDNAREIRIAREQAEEARLLAEAASRTKSAFLANMSHELRTPLNAIIGYSELLHEDAAERGDTASQSDLAKIQGAGRHLLGLINDILDLSKIESGRMDIHLEDVDLHRLAGEVNTLVAPLIGKNRNTLAIDIAPDIGVMHVDVVKLKQSLINLLSNAAKFTEGGVVRLGVVRKNAGAPNSAVVFTVADSGIGMTQEQMGRLFQAFTQADASTTRNYGGTGLGLTITKHFATMLGGTIEVTSEPGKGSVFTLTLPDGAHTQRADKPVEAGPSVSGAASGTTVLVVDDDRAVHDVLRLTLAKEGYRLLHAYDGEEALRLAAAQNPDVITLDVMMPRLDGWTVLGRLKSDSALASIPVIMLTVVDERTTGYSLGAAEYMTKPVDRARLLDLLRQFTARSQQAVVLVVDDDEGVRDIVSTTVEKTGLRAAQAPDGQAALDWLKANPAPALILLDLMMPVMDGFEFLQRVRDIPAAADVPIVVLTAKDLTDDERKVINERTMLVLTKGAQPLSSLGDAISLIARQPAEPVGRT